MAKRSVMYQRPIAPSTHFNLYAPSFPKKMSFDDIKQTVKAFGNSVKLAIKAGFDAVEIHAGHGYLISQFLSPYINKRKDAFGGSLANRMLFMQLVIEEVLKVANEKIAVLVKVNMKDGFKDGLSIDESLQVAKKLEQMGVHALVLSGGFVSKVPMYVMRGRMPLNTLSQHMNNPVMRLFVRLFGNQLIRPVPFKENYFMEDALFFRKALDLPLVYVGGVLSLDNILQALNNGFEAVAFARALIKDPDFINKLKGSEYKKSSCDTCNYCIAVMYSGPFQCIQNIRNQ